MPRNHFLQAARDAQRLAWFWGQPGWELSELENSGYEVGKFAANSTDSILGTNTLSVFGTDTSIPSSNEFEAGELGTYFGSFYQDGSFK